MLHKIPKAIINLLGNIYLFKVDNRNIRKGYEICSKLTIKNFEHISDVFIVDFEQVAITKLHLYEFEDAF